MKSRYTLLGSAAITFAVALLGCSNQSAGNPLYLGVDIQERPVSIPVGGQMQFTAAVSDAAAVPQWSILNAAATSSSAGSFTTEPAPANNLTSSILYTAPAAPPIYTAQGFTQGVVTLVVSATAPPGTSYPTATDSVTFYITAPSITVGLSPSTASVKLGTTQQFFGYAVGNVNNTLIWEVNGVPGGSTANGTITSPAGTYTAPATMPMGGNSVTITAVSQADLTKSASSTVTLLP
jgi:hypothetical protein